MKRRPLILWPGCDLPPLRNPGMNAVRWARATRNHERRGQKQVLLILATYTNNKTGLAYMSESSLIEDCEMPARTIQRHLHGLRKQGFLIRESRANQFQDSTYRLPLDQDPETVGQHPPSTAEANEAASAKQAPQVAGAKSEHPPSIRQASATGGAALEEDLNLGSGKTLPLPRTPLSISLSPEEAPDWLETLRSIEGWQVKGASHEATLIAWAGKNSITDRQLENAAIGLGGVQAKTLRGYVRLDLAFRRRVNMGFDVNGVAPTTLTPAEIQAQILEDDRLEYEKGRRT